MNRKRIPANRVFTGSAGLIWLVLSLFSVSEMPAQKATRSPETSILRFREIEGWKGTFSYKLDAGFKGAFGVIFLLLTVDNEGLA